MEIPLLSSSDGKQFPFEATWSFTLIRFACVRSTITWYLRFLTFLPPACVHTTAECDAADVQQQWMTSHLSRSTCAPGIQSASDLIYAHCRRAYCICLSAAMYCEAAYEFGESWWFGNRSNCLLVSVNAF